MARIRNDGWENVFTLLGNALADKRMGARFKAGIVDETLAEELWLGSDIAARIVELPAKKMFQRGFTVSISDMEPASLLEAALVQEPENVPDPVNVARELVPVEAPAPRADAGEDLPSEEEPGSDVESDPTIPKLKGEAEPLLPGESSPENDEKKEAEESLKAKLDDLNAYAHFRTCTEYSRAYGGAALLLGVRDGQADLTKELNERRVTSVDYLVPLRPRECVPAAWNSNPLSAGYGTPVRYRIQRESAGGVGSSSFEVHASRLIRFDGLSTSKAQRSRNRGWGISIFTRLWDRIRDFDAGYESTAVMLQDYAQSIYKMKGLADALASDDDDLIVKRARNIERGRSVCRAVLIDSEEEFERKATTLTGLPDVLDRMALRLAAGLGWPVSILMGDEPAGLNKSGTESTRWFYDELDSERESTQRPKINRLVKLLLISRDGPTGGLEPKRWTVNFPPMWTMSEKEEADLRQVQSLTDKAEVDAGIVLPEEIAVSRHGGDKWSATTKLDSEARAAAKKAEARAQIEQQKMMKEAAKKGVPPGGKPFGGGGKPPFAKKPEPAGA